MPATVHSDSASNSASSPVARRLAPRPKRLGLADRAGFGSRTQQPPVIHVGNARPRPMTTERARLLVVDDDAELRELAQAYLKQQGFDVETVADGSRDGCGARVALVRSDHSRSDAARRRRPVDRQATQRSAERADHHRFRARRRRRSHRRSRDRRGRLHCETVQPARVARAHPRGVAARAESTAAAEPETADAFRPVRTRSQRASADARRQRPCRSRPANSICW